MLSEALVEPAVLELYQRLRFGREGLHHRMPWVAASALVLAHVRKDLAVNEGKRAPSPAAQVGRVSLDVDFTDTLLKPLRFRRLLQARAPDEFMRELRRLVQVGDFARSCVQSNAPMLFSLTNAICISYQRSWGLRAPHEAPAKDRVPINPGDGGTHMPAPNAISFDKLSRILGTPRAPLLLDVRSEEDFAADPRLLPGATRVDDQALAALASQLGGQPSIAVCQGGHRRSQGTAAWLRAEGYASEYLEGGFEAWRAAELPLIDPSKLPERNTQGRTIWVTRSRPKIDRIACPWLIRRFLDPRAIILFVAPAEVVGVAERYNAVPFDIEGVFWSHRDDLCTFDVMLAEFGLTIPALGRLATIVRGADTARLDLAPEAAGLLAASLGLSRMYSDDLEQLDAGMLLYDALYRWARDATDETHNWPTNKPKAD